MPSTPLDLERALWHRGYRRVAGLDEAGRGCLAGPVVAAAVVFPEDVVVDGVADSKRLSAAQREALLPEIRAQAMAVEVGLCSPQTIDRLNILWAAMEAMRRAAAACTPPPEFLLIDGNRCFPDSPWPYETVVKGDARSHSIAAASIVAKVTRDRLMRDLHAEFPAYGWDRNAGYPTAAHYDALAAHGPTPYHRRSFRLERTGGR
ncbi:MAG: ribonuclease HII [Rhodothermales bacterium]|nr:ribonuclease HII [Rhodothermales bacterium]